MRLFSKNLLVLPAIHLFLVAVIFSFYITSPDPAKHDVWILLTYLDWPISLMLSKLLIFYSFKIDQEIMFLVIGGTIWWFFVSYIISAIYSAFTN